MLKKLFADKRANARRAVIAVLAVGFLIFVYFINQVQKPELVTTVGRTFERAKVVEVVKDNLQEDGRRYGEQTVRLLMLSGLQKGETVEATSSAGYLFGAGCTPGMEVITIQSVSGDISVTSVYSANREPVVYAFVLLFFLILCVIGGKQGVKASIGLIFTLACIILLYIPLIFRGFSPFWAAVLVAIVTTLVTMYLIGGPSKKTACAIVGSIAGVIIAGLAATGFGYFSGISGNNVSDIENLLFLGENTKIQVSGLLFSGLLIASLGAVMDVAISVASTINEIQEQNPSLSRMELFRSGISVGRDMMGTMSNTLILAFAGGSVSVLVTNYVYNLPYVQIINSYGIGIEIMQAFSGSMGVVLTVPIVAAVSAFSMASAHTGPVPAEEKDAAGPLTQAEALAAPPEEEALQVTEKPALSENPAAFRELLILIKRKAAPVIRDYWKPAVAVICLLILVFCGSRFYAVYSDYENGRKEYEKAAQTMSEPSPPSSSAAVRQSGVPVTPAADGFAFDYQKLTAQNSDAVGWLRLPETNLSYPIVQGKDNAYYLNHTFYKNNSSMGAIFLDSRIENGPGAKNSIMYGHNMRSGAMFAALCNFRDKGYYERHPEMELYSKAGKADYKIFSVHEAKPDSETYTYFFSDQSSYGSYLQKMKKLSLYDTGVETNAESRILTLSTCVNDARDMRFVVHAVVL